MKAEMPGAGPGISALHAAREGGHKGRRYAATKCMNFVSRKASMPSMPDSLP